MKWDEHIICFAYKLVVEPDTGYCVKAVENQLDSVAAEHLGWDVENFPVYPWLFADPGEFLRVLIDVGLIYLPGRN
jgi:hypothetical protein